MNYKQIKARCEVTEIISDLTTPVILFLKIRSQHSEALLLESSDYSSKVGSLSYIAFTPLTSIELKDGRLKHEDEQSTDYDLSDEMSQFIKSIDIEGEESDRRFQAIFGYTGYDCVQHFEQIQFDQDKRSEPIPTLRYAFYRHLIVFDHFHERLFIVDHIPEGSDSQIKDIMVMINRQDHQVFPFTTRGEEYSNMDDQDYMAMVTKGKEHCQRGDVFQIVLSRKFYQDFSGDEFNVYRALRSINPSPLMFYFDYGSFKIFGSSPEAQLVVKEGIAEIHPIAGTFRRTGDDAHDKAEATRLSQDPKETSEHVMLVDLARNDLSRNTDKVTVASFKDIQFFSHVIHLVSKVVGRVKDKSKSFQIYGDTFPAGTLSGAPKHKAMQLIDKYEPNGRTFYGGGIGLIRLDGDLLHAIIIRSFLSQTGTLTRQAGAGIVIMSDEANELQEVSNKLAALKKAIVQAEKIAY